MTKEEIQKNLMNAWLGIMGADTWESYSRAEARFKNYVSLARSNGYKVKKDKTGNYLPELED